MNTTRHVGTRIFSCAVFSFITLWALGVHAARAAVQSDLKGMDEIYGTYAPDGDCRREPRIKVDATGFTYTYHGRTTHPAAFLYQASFFAATANNPGGGDPDQTMFNPFPSGITQDQWGGLQAADWGPLALVTDSKTHTIEITFLAAQANGKAPSGTTPLQAALVRSSPYATCGAHIAKAAPDNKGESVTYPLRINFGAEGQVKPTRAQDAAIHRALGRYVRPTGNPRQGPYTMTVADLNDDGRLDLFVTFNNFEYCGKDGCSGAIVMATPNGYSDHAIPMPRFFGAIHILPGTHGGMHDLRFNDGPGPIWQWTGKDYAIPKADLPQSNMQPWKTAHAAGSPLMAYVTPIDSVIKRVLVACEQGRPLLLVLTKQPLSAEPATLTFVFRGWTVNTPLQRNASNANLWMADLSRSQLPYWFAHRGFDANSRQIAPLVTESYLRINGEMQGQISMQDSTAATRAALVGCYRY